MELKNKALGEIRPLVEEFKRELEGLYGSRLRELILYGSYARGEAETGSDLDFLLVLDKVEDPLAERESLSELICKLSLKYGVVLSVLPVSERALNEGQKPLYLNVRREGVAV